MTFLHKLPFNFSKAYYMDQNSSHCFWLEGQKLFLKGLKGNLPLGSRFATHTMNPRNFSVPWGVAGAG